MPRSRPRHAKDLSEIVKAAQRATGLTKQLLAFSRQQVLNASPLDLNAVVTDMTGMLGRLIGENIDVELVLAPDLALAIADRSQLEQVIMNLVVNARDAMTAGGRLTIETTNVDLENSTFHDEAVIARALRHARHHGHGRRHDQGDATAPLRALLHDQGAGKGTGLGLSTTYGIVKQSKGYIWVYSEMGRGTTFKVYLPHSTGRQCDSPYRIFGRTPAAAPSKRPPRRYCSWKTRPACDTSRSESSTTPATTFWKRRTEMTLRKFSRATPTPLICF